MGLSSELASQFAKVTNDSSRNTNGTKLYGTITMLGEVPHVKLDGTEELTPISRTVEVAEGDRVEVMIANHSATVTGNLTDPSIGIMRAGNMESKITQTAEQIQLQVSDLEKNLDSKITQTAEQIQLQVSDLEKNLDSKITQTATEIRSEVSDLDGQFSENITTVENGIRNDMANSLASMSDTLTGISNDLSGLEESTNSSISTINASIETLTFNVSDLNSKITQTAAEIRSEVSAEVTDLNATIVNTETGIRDTINIEVANLDSKITQTATSIQTDVSAKFKTVDGEIEKFSTFKQTVEGFSFMGTGGTVKISGGDINLTGAISFSDLSDATTKQQEINAINSTASSALSTANGAASTASSALSTANDAASTASSALSTANSAASDADSAYSRATTAINNAKAIANGAFSGGTFIDGTSISSPVIVGGELFALDRTSYAQITSDGLYMYTDGHANPKVMITYSSTEALNPQVDLILGAGSSNNSDYKNRFFIQKGKDRTGLYYYDNKGNMSGLTFMANSKIEVHGTGIGTSTTVTAVWG